MKVETDHKPLMSIWKKSIANTSTRVRRLLLRLLQYDIDIQYLPGKRNVIADVLSRVSPLPPKAEDIKAINCIVKNELSVNIPASKTKMEEFQDLTYRDITLQELAKTVHKVEEEVHQAKKVFVCWLQVQFYYKEGAERALSYFTSTG